MPRVHIRKLGSRTYADYSQETLEQCLNDIRTKSKTQREASEYYHIPRSTIKNKLKGVFNNKPGRQPVFSSEEEIAIKEHVKKLSEFGFPISEFELRYVMKCYLDKQGRKVKEFEKNKNMPGYEWGKLFLKRHPDLTTRVCSNIKRERAGIDEDTINAYFENLEHSVAGVPPENIWNYDETNLTDDPGASKVICKKGSKYVERVMNSSKSSTSLMMCGNAVGELLSIYVVYRADHLWTTWTEGGPKGCRYNRSKSGWFDAAIFEDWFFSTVLPRLRKQQGHKVLIGDNLSSHININVLKACAENQIRFVCLPPHSTHLTQPLDVAYFHPMKVAWRQILKAWKQSADGQKFGTVQKDHFAKLLNELYTNALEAKGQNLISGFRKCGIVPLDKSQLLERLPKKDVQADIVGDAFMQALIHKRTEVAKPASQIKRRKKLNVLPGKSISVDDLEDAGDQNVSKEVIPRTAKKRGRPKLNITESDSSLEKDDFSVHDDSAEDDNGSDIFKLPQSSDEDSDWIESGPSTFIPKSTSTATNWKDALIEGDFVVVQYNNVNYPGQITHLPSERSVGPTVKCMEKLSKNWKWPNHEDIMVYTWEDVVQKISPPKNLKRGFFSVPELDNYMHA